MRGDCTPPVALTNSFASRWTRKGYRLKAGIAVPCPECGAVLKGYEQTGQLELI